MTETVQKEHQRLYKLTEHMLTLMQKNDGPISFQDWMQAALYEPKLGYYESEEVFGQSGDFTTASSMGSWLSLGLLDTIQKSWEALGKPTHWSLIEQGGGNGELMCNVLDALQSQNLMPTQVFAVEASTQLQQRQSQICKSRGFDVQVVKKLKDIPKLETAIMYSNELPDAFPVQSFKFDNNQIIQRGVDWDGQKFIWTALSSLDLPISDEIQKQWPDDYVSEFNPHLQSWQTDISQTFERGVVLTIDYGYTAKEYYRPQRIEGTLMGHYQHQIVNDVLQLSPGVCDITAHVDFSWLKKVGELVGLDSVAYTTQGAWLAQSESVQQQLQKLAANPSVDNIAQITHAKRLMLPTGMGESFKLLIQSKGLDNGESLRTKDFDRLHTL
ncbi:MAG: SAM-dependent methyltransferase [Ghiorsea sp.]